MQFHALPDTGVVPLVTDATSEFLMRPLPVERFGAIYASAQKNLGVAGLTLVIVDQQLLGQPHPMTPAVFDYTRLVESGSRVNTIPAWPILVAGEMVRWIEAEGGLSAMAARNRAKAVRLYAAIDQSGFYHCAVDPACRSTVNVCFGLPSPQLEAQFLVEARRQGLHHLDGHSVNGGIRASLYNAMELSGVEALIQFMQRFAEACPAAPMAGGVGV